MAERGDNIDKAATEISEQSWDFLSQKKLKTPCPCEDQRVGRHVDASLFGRRMGSKNKQHTNRRGKGFTTQPVEVWPGQRGPAAAPSPYLGDDGGDEGAVVILPAVKAGCCLHLSVQGAVGVQSPVQDNPLAAVGLDVLVERLEKVPILGGVGRRLQEVALVLRCSSAEVLHQVVAGKKQDGQGDEDDREELEGPHAAHLF